MKKLMDLLRTNTVVAAISIVIISFFCGNDSAYAGYINNPSQYGINLKALAQTNVQLPTSPSGIYATVGATSYYAGDPNGNVAGQLRDAVYDTANARTYYCIVAGNAATAQWEVTRQPFGINRIQTIGNGPNGTFSFGTRYVGDTGPGSAIFTTPVSCTQGTIAEFKKFGTSIGFGTLSIVLNPGQFAYYGAVVTSNGGAVTAAASASLSITCFSNNIYVVDNVNGGTVTLS